MKTRIVVDSTADILPEYLDQIHTVPLTVFIGSCRAFFQNSVACKPQFTPASIFCSFRYRSAKCAATAPSAAAVTT